MLLGMGFASIPLVQHSFLTPKAYQELQLEIIYLLRMAMLMYTPDSRDNAFNSLPPRPSYISDGQLIDSILSFSPPATSPNVYSIDYATSEFCWFPCLGAVLRASTSSESLQTLVYQNNVIPQNISRLHAFMNHLRFTGNWGSTHDTERNYNTITHLMLVVWDALFKTAWHNRNTSLVHQAIDSGILFCLEHMICFADPQNSGKST